MAEVARSGSTPQTRGSQSAHQILESDAFRALVKKRWSVSMSLLVALFVLYYGYIVLIASSKELVSQKIGEVTTLAIPIGAAVIVLAWVLTALYVGWANKKYDPEVERLKSQLKH